MISSRMDNNTMTFAFSVQHNQWIVAWKDRERVCCGLVKFSTNLQMYTWGLELDSPLTLQVTQVFDEAFFQGFEFLQL